jgi:PAS domain S-box-containing protein
MKKESETPSNSLPSDETFAEAAKLMEGKSNVLDNILASMGDGMSIVDRNMRIVYQNKFMIDHFGSHIGEFCYNIYERRESLCEGCPIVEAYRTQKVTKALRVGTTKDGKQFRFENIASVLRNHQGEIVAGIELVRLVEDRERALDELRAAMERLEQAKAIYESSGEGIMVLDRDNRIISVNPAFKCITGYSYDEVAGADPNILASGRHTAEFYAEIRRSLQETGTWRGEIWNQRKNGQVYPQFMRIDTVLGDDGEVSKRVCIFSDITEQKRLESLLSHTRKMESLGKLASGAAHEIRNPLNIMSLRLQMLDVTGKVLDDDVRKVIDTCNNQIRRITGVLDGLQEFSRMPLAEKGLDDLNKITGGVVDSFDAKFKSEGITAEIRRGEDVPPFMLDKEKIAMVITHLISNAVDAMRGRDIRHLIISTGNLPAKDDTGPRVRIVVSDTGHGIKEEEMARIFDPFFTTKDPDKGKGLGLAVAYGIIGEHGGRIWAENNDWGGATFIIELPIGESQVS